MSLPVLAETLIRPIVAVTSAEELAQVMADICDRLGFEHFALTHHVDILTARSAIRLHNYPAQWADYYDRNAIGVTDPVHRASHRTSVGFLWSSIASLIPLTTNDRKLLDRGRDEGIGDGFTVPAHVPGEARGSVSFANRADTPIDAAMLPAAQLVGNFAFEAARHLWHVDHPGIVPMPVLTDRQRDCVLWAARGKGDWEISRILGVSQETVAMHIKQARERYGVGKRTLVAIRALFDGTLSFDDILDR
jgi:LuxR family quorum-sensing system transcriptional regulator CciR